MIFMSKLLITQKYQALVEHAFDNRAEWSAREANPEVIEAVTTILNALDQGILRVAEQIDGVWHTHQWIKKAILLYFKLHDSQYIAAQPSPYFDKIPLKFANWQEKDFQQAKLRIVPQACVRFGSFLGAGSIVMPAFVNLGAYVGSDVMVDTWATVGSCAQIGNRVHLSGGVGIGGVLEPLQANPTIIEDDCFIGARSEVVEGVIVERGAVLSMGVYIGQSTKIYDRETGKISYGRIPQNSVVVPGSLPSSDGKCQQYCVVIAKRVDEKTRAKIDINDLLRIAQDEK